MVVRTFLYFLKFPKISGIIVPFKVYWKSKIHIGKNATLNFGGRVKIGNNRHQPVVSLLPINLWFGEKSTISFGKSVCIGPGVNMIVKENATLKIGDRTYFTSDLHLEAVKCIEIGSDCAVSWGATIIDDNHHKVLPKTLSKNGAEFVKIGNHVWIGCNVTILKGTEIGENCIVAAGSIAKGKFPPNSLIGGNPAKVIKDNVSWE